MPVTGVARDRAALDHLRAELGSSFIPVAADAADPVVAGQLIDACRPGLLVLNAGAPPLARPIQRHTWETFSRNWEVDVRQVFHWTREALLPQLTPVTGLGAAAVAAYAAREGIGTAAFTERAGPPLTAEQVATAVLDLAAGDESGLDAYLLTGAGLSPAP